MKISRSDVTTRCLYGNKVIVYEKDLDELEGKYNLSCSKIIKLELKNKEQARQIEFLESQMGLPELHKG